MSTATLDLAPNRAPHTRGDGRTHSLAELSKLTSLLTMIPGAVHQLASRHGKGKGRAHASHLRRPVQLGALKPLMVWMPSDPGRALARKGCGQCADSRSCQYQEIRSCQPWTYPVAALTRFTSLQTMFNLELQQSGNRHGKGQRRVHGLTRATLLPEEFPRDVKQPPGQLSAREEERRDGKGSIATLDLAATQLLQALGNGRISYSLQFRRKEFLHRYLCEGTDELGPTEREDDIQACEDADELEFTEPEGSRNAAALPAAAPRTRAPPPEAPHAARASSGGTSCRSPGRRRPRSSGAPSPVLEEAAARRCCSRY